ncbi:hypothetical protein MKX73_12455 [Solibacillus sp. FSL W7-1436]|uniref:hypothetical protein n=1 Tax=Solibacillus sp. FSL W7-1436 TaxID=2921705 RepID=UPI0030F9C6AD
MKKLKYVLIALLVIVLGVAGYLVYELKFKSYDTADTEVDALLEETFEITLPDGSVILVDKEGNIVDDKADNSAESDTNGVKPTDSSSTTTDNDSEEGTPADSTSANADGKSDDETVAENGSTGTNTNANKSTNTNNSTDSNNSNPASSTKPNGGTKPQEKVTVSSIKAQYTPTFASIENQARARINGLVSQAYDEYKTKKKNGESIQYGYFYRKYMGAATAMEKSTDATVKTVVGLVEKDLQANGFDKSYAQTFMEDYKATKKALRDDMMDKALNFR